MADTSEKVHALKIDRDTAVSGGSGRLWLLVPAVFIVVVVGWWFVLRPQLGAALVEVDAARRPPSIAAASSVLDASGYVVARRQASTMQRNVRNLILRALRLWRRERRWRKPKHNFVRRSWNATGCGIWPPGS
jgi:hypothetical protein